MVGEFYLAKLIAWPWDEIVLADSIADLVISHAITVGGGWASATARYWMNPGYGAR